MFHYLVVDLAALCQLWHSLQASWAAMAYFAAVVVLAVMAFVVVAVAVAVVAAAAGWRRHTSLSPRVMLAYLYTPERVSERPAVSTGEQNVTERGGFMFFLIDEGPFPFIIFFRLAKMALQLRGESWPGPDRYSLLKLKLRQIDFFSCQYCVNVL